MHLLAIAPMVDWTNSHMRVFLRLLLPKAVLYTDMIALGALLHQPEKMLTFQAEEQPVILQVGGSDLAGLAHAAQLAEQWGYDGINLNVGCPSAKVQSGRFGACLMKEPEHVVLCIRAMKEACNIPVSIKTRIGVDQQDSYEFFRNFIIPCIEAGIDGLTVHARKAWLTGLNPKQNRSIPPLHYDYVYALKKEFPALPISINGNIQSVAEVQAHLAHVDGVMLGRMACDNPYALTEIHRALYPEVPLLSRQSVWEAYLPYIEQQFSCGVPLSILCKHLLPLAHGFAGAKIWRAQLTQAMQRKDIREIYQNGVMLRCV
ncbi:MAG: tRNA dihydrouridine(20/20a) synthase DusA [Legionellaceae bacterium]|nr:tRNA dihydrouridine(20/20a) synthase DusA [Legionellaceae bacterium]